MLTDAPAGAAESALPTFMFADIAGFSALTEQHGDEAAMDLARLYEVLVVSRLPNSARLVKMIGDAAMIVGTDETDCALLALRLLSDAEEQLPGKPALRIGMHAGEAAERAGDYWGHAVNVAARVAARAEACEALLTAAVRERVRTERLPPGTQLIGIGTQRVRNIAESLELFALRVRCDDLVLDPVCRMRLNAADAHGTLRVNDRTYHFCSLACAGKFALEPGLYIPALT